MSSAAAPYAGYRAERSAETRPGAAQVTWRDPRVPFALLLTLYAVLGCTVLRFNRSPVQMALTVAGACLLDVLFAYRIRGTRWLVPLSAYITGLSLAILLNYSHHSPLLFLPVYLAIGSKYVLTYQGRHVFNPSLFGVAASLLLAGGLITTAPAYQWGGSWAMSLFVITAAVVLFVSRIGRNVLILAFLGFYLVQILLRAYWMRWYLPPEALILGTLTSTPFYIFVFYMLTDPQTSPATRKGQAWLALAVTVVDLLFHRLTSLYTFFYAAFAIGSGRFILLHLRRLWREKPVVFSRIGRLAPATRRAALVVGATGVLLLGARRAVAPVVAPPDPGFRMVEIGRSQSGIDSRLDPGLLDRVDPRVRHVAKWLLSAGDAGAVADFDNDGRIDLYLTNPLKRPQDRNALYRNLGDLRFERVDLPALRALSEDPLSRGLAASPVFADYDNDGDQDLLLGVGYGRCVLLRNLMIEEGRPGFADASAMSGLEGHATSVAANFLDFDRDGRLDILVANAFNPLLELYRPPRPLNVFRLPPEEYPGDRRMLPFMHSSWDDAENGGRNALYRNAGGGRFERLDIAAWGMPETHWSLAVGTGDLNNDGWTDLYIGNDFGPDDLYLNEAGRHFRRIQGRMVGSVGRDTYKGMNSSLADIDRNGYLDVYVSNVHVPLQAEGSLLWMTFPPRRAGDFVPRFHDEATQRGALNEHSFGWGAAIGDLNNDGWLDIVQANGMVDDTPDRRFPECPSYWYVNEKLMRSGPEIHTYADMWGDLRGRCINGREPNRVYLSRGDRKRLQFADVALEVGVTERTNSRGMILADFDNDGDLDLAATHQFAPLTLYRNTLYGEREKPGAPPRSPHWIGFSLEGDGGRCNRDAAGSRVWVSYRDTRGPGDQEQFREITVSNAFAAQGDRRAVFGLGEHAGPVGVSVSWCGQARRPYGKFAADRYHTIRQTEGPTRP